MCERTTLGLVKDWVERCERLRYAPLSQFNLCPKEREFMTDALKQEAREILNMLAFAPFENCQPLSRTFVTLPARPGLYAVRHKDNGLLYIGKAKSLRGRFSGGHKAFLWAWLDKYNDEDIRIALHPLSPWENPGLLLEIEAIILRATEPPYNVQIPLES